jgi:hypothetical protein
VKAHEHAKNCQERKRRSIRLVTIDKECAGKRFLEPLSHFSTGALGLPQPLKNRKLFFNEYLATSSSHISWDMARIPS